MKKILLLLFLISISVGVIGQVFADSGKSQTSAGEEIYNPFGDPWSTNTGPNADIPVGLTPGCYRSNPKLSESVPTEEELDYLAKSNSPILFEECASIQFFAPKLTLIADGLHARNPNIKYIGYAYLHVGNVNQTEYTFVDQNHEDWFIHRKNMPATRENRVKVGGNPLYNITNPDFQNFMAQVLKEDLDRNHMDGFLSDEVHQNLRNVDPNSIPPEIYNNWGDQWPVFLGKIKQAIGPDRLIFSNADLSELQFNSRVLNSIDGFFFEDPIGPVGVDFSFERAGFLNNHLNEIDRQGKRAIIAVSTNVNGTNFSTTYEGQERAWERYYLAAYLNIFRNSNHSLIYYTPTSIGPQYNSETFFKDWNLKIGSPVSGSMQQVAPHVYRRQFSNGIAYWNNSNSGYQIPASEPANMSSPEGAGIRNYMLGPSSGQVFVAGAPTPTPTPTPTPSPTPTPDLGQGEIVEITRVLHPSGLRFWTMSQPEVALLVSQGWIREGRAYNAYSPYAAQPQDTVPMFRLKNSTEWFWTISQPEVDLLVRNGWIFEGTAYYVYSPYNPQPANTEKIYRVYDTQTGARFWTNSLVEANFLVAQGKVNEGVAFYTPLP